MRYSLPPTAAACPERGLKHPVGRSYSPAQKPRGYAAGSPHHTSSSVHLSFRSGFCAGDNNTGAGPQQPDHGPCIGVRHIRLAVDQHVHEKRFSRRTRRPTTQPEGNGNNMDMHPTHSPGTVPEEF